jgi:ATP-binding cassette subfamily B protein
MIPLQRHRGLLTTYLMPQRFSVGLLAGSLATSIALQLVSPQIVGYFIDTAQSHGSQDALTTAGALFLIVAVAQRAVALAAVYIGENVGWAATNRLREDLARHCIRLDMSFHKSRTPGELIERIDGDVTALANFFSRFVINIFGNGVLVVGILIFLFRADGRIGPILTAYTVLTFVALRLFGKIAVTRYTASRQSSAEQFGFIEERISGREDIRANGGEPYVMSRLYRFMRSRLEKARAAQLTVQMSIFSTDFLYVMGYALGLGFGAYLYTRHEITIGTAYQIVFYIGMLVGPLNNIRGEIQDLRQATASIGRVDELLHTDNQIVETIRATLPMGALSVDVRDVSFRYEAGEHVLRDVSFHLEPGCVLGLLGRTGSGKTTLTRLLVRLYDPTVGGIQLGGVDLRDIAIADIRRHVGMVTQDVQLFGASVRDNLTFFDPRTGDDRILGVLQELGLWQWYQRLPAGLDTVLAPGGAGLSAGEAQLLAFARVFLKDPRLVILDEASSRLDPSTERVLENAIDRLLHGRTGIVIAHRLKTVQRVDEIMILEGGRIVEHGRRRDLAENPETRFHRLLSTGMDEALA